MSPASLGIVCFRARFDGVDDEDTIAQLNSELVRGFEATGRGLLSSTKLHGRYAIRLCVMNHTSGPGDVEATLSWFASAPEPQGATRSTTKPTRTLTRPSGRMGRCRRFDAETVRRFPCSAARRRRAGGRRQIRAPAAGRAGGGCRHPLAGHAAVLRNPQRGGRGARDDDVLRELGPGDHFGELAALDWGAGFGYARTAHVVATSPLRLLVLPASGLNELVRQAPELDRRLRAAARERLTRI